MTPPLPTDDEPIEYAVQLRGIVKRFGSVLANDQVDLSVPAGQVHALMGENGAGKSTLMSVLYGLHRPDAGSIAVHGREVAFSSPAQAIEAGLGMVQQGFALFGELSVADNVIFGREPTRRGLIDRKAALAGISELIERHDLRVRPQALVRDLPVGVRQRVEILKLLYRRARVLILDEPTAVLTPAETDRLFEVLRELVAQDHTVLLVSHKLNEVLEVSDEVTVLRDGRVSLRARTAETSDVELAQAMTGREVDLDRVQPAGRAGEPVLEVSALRSGPVDNVSLTVRAGEIVGIAGVAGNGQTELIETIVGLRRLDPGAAPGPAAGAASIRLCGKEISRLSVRDRRSAGLAYVPEDQAEVGSAPNASLTANLGAGFHRSLSKRGVLRPATLRAHAESIVRRFGVRTSGVEAPIRTLSGGNQQKAIVGRELDHEAPLLVVEQPTRGVDVGAIERIHAELVSYRDAGHAVLLVSAELSEILALSDRILVMYAGTVAAEFTRQDADVHRIGLAMAGGHR